MKAENLLQTILSHLSLSPHPVPPYSFYTFGIEYRIFVINALIFKPNISFLGHEDTRMVNLDSVIATSKAPRR